MRLILEHPVKPELLAQASQLVEQIYALHEAGRSYDQCLSGLSELVGKVVTPYQVCAAFGSVSPKSFAHDLLVDWTASPADLDRSEMLELLQRVLQPKRGELRSSYWLACLKQNTGDPRLSDLIYWPGEYFHDGDNSRELSAEEILRIALANGYSNGGTHS